MTRCPCCGSTGAYADPNVKLTSGGALVSCPDCRFRWTTAMYGVGTYAKPDRKEVWWDTVPIGTLPVFREEAG